MSKQTIDDRLELVRKFTQDPDVTLTEALAHIYHWSMSEYHRIKRNRHNVNYAKHLNRINDDVDVLKFRKKMKDL